MLNGKNCILRSLFHSKTFYSFAPFKAGQTSEEDDAQSGHPSTSHRESE
jgi:hypothetical protein